MKKFLITCFYLSVTLAVCAASFWLPATLGRYQDRQISAKIEHTEMEPPELTYSSSLYDTLRLFSKNHYFVDYPSVGSKRSDEEIYETALELVKQLQKYDVLSSGFTDDIANYTTQLQLAILSEKTLLPDIATVQADSARSNTGLTGQDDPESSASDITTAVVWSCSIYFDSGYWIDIWIDDKSGKAVSFSMFIEQTRALASSGSRAILDTFADAAASFAEHYYELPTTVLEPSFVNSYNSLFGQDASILEAYYTIQLKEENSTNIQIPLKIRPECTILN